MSTLRVLITGFGAFPGVDRNFSTDLAIAVCSALTAEPQPSSPATLTTHAAELDVAWQSVDRHLADLYDQHRPNLAIHFGVCSSVTGLAIEQRAQNQCAPALDACGNLPMSDVLDVEAVPEMETRLSISNLIADCPNSNVHISPSQDAGQYLCNAAYFTSLSLAARQTPPSDALFIHVPDTLTPDTAPWPQFVQAAKRIVNAAITLHQGATR